MDAVTARTICRRALFKVGAAAVGQDPGDEDINDAFADLQGMIEQWRIDRVIVYRLAEHSFVGSGAQTYTIGPTGLIVTDPRPDRLEWAFLRQLVPAAPNQVDFPMRVIQSREDYSAITLKTMSTLPWSIFYDPTVPNGVLYPWPLPTSAYEVHILVKHVLEGFANLDATLTLPHAYYEAILYNLCVRLATSYPSGGMSQDVYGLARDALQRIALSTAAIPELRMPRVLAPRGRGFNVYSGY